MCELTAGYMNYNNKEETHSDREKYPETGGQNTVKCGKCNGREFRKTERNQYADGQKRGAPLSGAWKT